MRHAFVPCISDSKCSNCALPSPMLKDRVVRMQDELAGGTCKVKGDQTSVTVGMPSLITHRLNKKTFYMPFSSWGKLLALLHVGPAKTQRSTRLRYLEKLPGCCCFLEVMHMRHLVRVKGAWLRVTLPPKTPNYASGQSATLQWEFYAALQGGLSSVYRHAVARRPSPLARASNDACHSVALQGVPRVAG
eukprot:240046-Amphidinium_carterae.1